MRKFGRALSFGRAGVRGRSPLRPRLSEAIGGGGQFIQGVSVRELPSRGQRPCRHPRARGGIFSAIRRAGQRGGEKRPRRCVSGGTGRGEGFGARGGGWCNYGVCLVHGFVGRADPPAGASLVKRAADQRLPTAQHRSAVDRQEGTGAGREVAMDEPLLQTTERPPYPGGH
jgi:hypothetical protein